MNFLLIFALLPLILAFKFTPMSQSLELAEGVKSSQFLVENDSAENMAIELSVKERKMNRLGKEELPGTTELSIFPPQIIIPAKEKRTIRVLWNGPSKIETEKAFRVVAEQLPLNVNGKVKKGTGIQMLMKYMAAFYITPPDAESKIKVILESAKNGKITFAILNTGNKHQIIYKPVMTFKKGSKKWTLTSKELAGISGENVLAKSERSFTINSAELIPENAEVSLKIED